MNPEIDVEALLRKAPQPQPPAELLARLEEQIQLEPGHSSQSGRGNLPDMWRRLWFPLTGLVGLTAVLVILFVAGHAAGTRVLGQSVEALRQVRTFRVIERVRSGPSLPVIKNKSKRSMDWPNYHTTLHPLNPMVETHHWFQADPSGVSEGKTHSVSPTREVWRDGNVVLELNRQTGERGLKLNSSRTMFAGIANPLVNQAEARLKDVTRRVPEMTPELAARYWVGEWRWRFNGSVHIQRFWIDRANHLPARIQVWQTEWPEIAPEVLIQEWEFTDYNVPFGPETFQFEATADDLAPLGITREQLATLPQTVFSMRITGDAGMPMQCTLKDRRGNRVVSGTLPLTIVHDRNGDLSYTARFEDGREHNVGIMVNDSAMSTLAHAIIGRITDTETSMEGSR
jgi:hypothetical protein